MLFIGATNCSQNNNITEDLLVSVLQDECFKLSLPVTSSISVDGNDNPEEIEQLIQSRLNVRGELSYRLETRRIQRVYLGIDDEVFYTTRERYGKNATHNLADLMNHTYPASPYEYESTMTFNSGNYEPLEILGEAGCSNGQRTSRYFNLPDNFTGMTKRMFIDQLLTELNIRNRNFILYNQWEYELTDDVLNQHESVLANDIRQPGYVGPQSYRPFVYLRVTDGPLSAFGNQITEHFSIQDTAYSELSMRPIDYDFNCEYTGNLDNTIIDERDIFCTEHISFTSELISSWTRVMWAL